ncbi:MAG: ATP-binding protein [Bacteroidales bacterium]|jgi:predicted HTH transcriptional regulator|nr:ATP-binding protein [Bacteroidales bacterium]
MSEYIYSLIKQGEHQKLDFKHSISDSKKIARSLAAFANTNGGKLLVGVRDNGSIAGVHGDEEFYMVQAAADMYCKPSFRFEIKAWNLQGKTILEISIPKLNNDLLIAAPNKDGVFRVYIRVKDQNLIVNSIYLKAWNKKKHGDGILIRYDKPERQLFEYLQENKSITFSQFIKISELSRYKVEKVLVNLIVLDLIKIVFAENKIVYELVKPKE